jgi:hypothetical protein
MTFRWISAVDNPQSEGWREKLFRNMGGFRTTPMMVCLHLIRVGRRVEKGLRRLSDFGGGGWNGKGAVTGLGWSTCDAPPRRF